MSRSEPGFPQLPLDTTLPRDWKTLTSGLFLGIFCVLGRGGADQVAGVLEERLETVWASEVLTVSFQGERCGQRGLYRDRSKDPEGTGKDRLCFKDPTEKLLPNEGKS